MQGWLREPLVHFLAGGALLLALFAWKGEPADPASREISINSEVLGAIAGGFEAQMGRAPTDAELDSLTQRYVREEVLYREALRLGLDQDDAIIRRRLAQKMDLIAAARVDAALPADEVLEDWLTSHPARFADEARYTVDQVRFEEEQAAHEGIEALRDGADTGRFASTLDLPSSMSDVRRRELLDRFGTQFVRELDGLEASSDWQGPIPSGLGWHAVRLRSVRAAELPPLDTIRERVLADWRAATAAKREEEAYQLLREAYTVDIER
ncbi:peptidyl-prolyl cis-trans isomerase [Altererythrobacter sp. GH1-8]|uniref:peptidylprolyl isomerase n=1 Tax=Altererythrobacter sp. GH1-8 TaxID=3349333 RepID=UPI00374DD32E